MRQMGHVSIQTDEHVLCPMRLHRPTEGVERGFKRWYKKTVEEQARYPRPNDALFL